MLPIPEFLAKVAEFRIRVPAPVGVVERHVQQEVLEEGGEQQMHRSC